MKLQFSVRALLLVTSLCCVLVVVPYWWPKKTGLAINPEYYVGYYRGLGLTDDPGYFGKDYYRIVVTEDTEGFWEVDVKTLGYNRYRGYYSNGALREEGWCMVEKNAFDIAPMRHDIRDGTYYSPDGELLSEIKNRNGKQILCYDNGQPAWELVLVDGKYSHAKMWYRNGQLAHESRYRSGEQHGEALAYHENGQVKYRGRYADGKPIGKWVRYFEDGTVRSEENYDGVD